MVFRINFGDEQSAVPNGYTLDFGEAYSASQGFGWVTEADLITPLDITPNGRDRELSNGQLIDTFIHMQYPEDNPNPDAVKIPAAWLYDLADGEYRVTVGVGDAAFNDSVHTINVEGVSAIADFIPDAENSFATATEIVTVDDGQLTIDAIGGDNTKLDFIEIAPITETKINFGLNASPAPADYLKDFGLAYSEEAGYGWITADSVGNSNATPLDISINARDRNETDDSINDSLIHMQFPVENPNPNAVKTPAAWEYAIPNGQYRVTAEVGDPAYTDSSHTINIEDIKVIDDFVPTAKEQFASATELITVDDGKLTIEAAGGENTKLNFVEISSVTEAKINFGPEDFNPIAEDYYRDFGESYSDSRGYGWVTQDSANTTNPIPIDLTANTRVRDLVEDPLSDSLIHMQYPEDNPNPDAVKTPAAWEYAIPNGTYEVKVGVGDAAFTDSIHVINIEGIETISEFIPSSDELFTTATGVVDVTDGRLTIDAIGGDNTKLDFIEIASIT